jgi:copper resistance protein D
LILFGMSAYALYAARGVSSSEQRMIRLAAIGAVISAVVWLGCEGAELSGEPQGAFDPSTLTAVLTQTEFGRLWIFRLGLAFVVAAGVFFMRMCRVGPRAMLSLASGLLLVSLAGTGHAASEDALHRTGDIVHLAAAGIWLGGLCALGLRGFVDHRSQRLEVVRFANVALAAVALLVVTGIANAAFLTDWRQIPNMAYGRVLLTKSALVLCMIGAAAMSRRRLAAHAAPVMLRRTVVLEQVFGALVLLATSILGTLSPS